MGTPLGPKYIPYTYMDPLGKLTGASCEWGSGSYSNPYPKGPKYLYGTKYGFCSRNFPYGLGKYTPYGYLGPFGLHNPPNNA